MILILMASCESKVSSKDPAFDWGHLPALESNHFTKNDKCTHSTYPRNFHSVLDIGKSLHIQGEIASGISHSLLLSNTCIQASIATSVYLSEEFRDKSHYTISVQIPIKDQRCAVDNPPNSCKSRSNAFAVVFSRDFTKEEIGLYFKGKKLSDVISYNPEIKKVNFLINSKAFSYELPRL
jgi:hypothetical protein